MIVLVHKIIIIIIQKHIEETADVHICVAEVRLVSSVLTVRHLIGQLQQIERCYSQ